MLWLEKLRVDEEKYTFESCSWKTTVHKKLLYYWNNLKDNYAKWCPAENI